MVLVPTNVGTAVAVNTGLALVGLAKKQDSLTPSGLANAWLLGVILLSSFVGWRGYTTCAFFVIAFNQKKKNDF